MLTSVSYQPSTHARLYEERMSRVKDKAILSAKAVNEKEALRKEQDSLLREKDSISKEKDAVLREEDDQKRCRARPRQGEENVPEKMPG